MSFGDNQLKNNVEQVKTSNGLELVSHALCPYVQRAVIVLTEKQVPHTRTYVDLGEPPGWFRQLSPLGKVPLLRTEGEVLFESAVICEYLEDTHQPSLHPSDPLRRAKHRAWMEFGSATLDNIWSFYTASDDGALLVQAGRLHAKFATLEGQLQEGPYFDGGRFCMVDAVYGPVFRYFDVFDQIADFGIFDGLNKVKQWRAHLAQRPSVKNAVAEDYPLLLSLFLKNLESALTRKMD